MAKTSAIGNPNLKTARVVSEEIAQKAIKNSSVDQQDEFSATPIAKKARLTHGNKTAVVISPPPPSLVSLRELAYLQIAQTKRSPSPIEHPVTKSKTRSFNHTHEFAIEDNMIWARLKDRARWEPLFFDGFPDRSPVTIDSDGANLIVVDELNQVHYKKVLREFRQCECDYDNDPVLAAARPQAEGHPYVVVDICQENNWIDRWFKLPVIKHVANMFMERRLVIPKNARAVAISHRGRYNNYVEDKLLRRHPVGTGVTTLYALDQNGQDIHKYDPWSPPWAKTILPLPETETTSFIANNISVSASTIMVIGYERNWVTGQYTPKIITRLADIDTEGGNPALKYSFVDGDHLPKVRVLPFDEVWQEHPLELTGRATLSDNITIRQIGEGNHMRELIVEGTDAKGLRGYYRKNLWEKKWSFVPNSECKGRSLSPLDTAISQSTVRNYEGRLKNHEAKLVDFGLRSSHAKIHLVINDKTHILNLYRRFSLASFFGVEKYQYDLVLPESHPDLSAIFGDRLALEVSVKEQGEKVKIHPKSIANSGFKFEFSRSPN
ncbi:MAG TPA: hypothetical protein VEL47_01715 [Myxococcota bacterium]|nr:hypothetical protein [Myxococcota bacterium]